MELYNTLTNQKEEFRSLKKGQVGLYVCGPTVYDYGHLGHARTYLTFDLLVRFLKELGNKVKYVQNITDVGHLLNDSETGPDKVKTKAQETGQTSEQIVRHYTEAHLKDMKDLHILLPDIQPKASEEIKTIIDFISGLIEKGFAYVTSGGNVYFRVSKKIDYGKLSHRGLAEIITGTRIEPAKDKHSAADFALWKAAPYGAKDMVWDSPWGKGFPGWHIECSAMSRKYLGDEFDIHGSSIEHIFPHHENEIAQSEALTGHIPARYWVHGGMLMINGVKMSKSLKNVVSVQDALKEYSANEIRCAFYQTHYRRPFDYTRAAMEQGVALRRKIFTAYAEAGNQGNPEALEQILADLNNDLDSPKALQVWAAEAKHLSKEQTEKLFQLFGLVFKDIDADVAAAKLKADRQAARQSKDFLTADNRKAELLQMGFEAIDSDDQTIYISR